MTLVTMFYDNLCHFLWQILSRFSRTLPCGGREDGFDSLFIIDKFVFFAGYNVRLSCSYADTMILQSPSSLHPFIYCSCLKFLLISPSSAKSIDTTTCYFSSLREMKQPLHIFRFPRESLRGETEHYQTICSDVNRLT